MEPLRACLVGVIIIGEREISMKEAGSQCLMMGRRKLQICPMNC